MLRRSLVFLLACVSLPLAASAQRRPVLPQIDLPHPYYYRELYLPQLTGGPSSVAWMPDSKEVIFSMAGSLWRQKLNSREATQLTDGPGYDYQPDCSPDGRAVVYVSYQKDAMELWLLDLASGQTTQLTTGGAVNIEPRWSPDGNRIVFVSTSYSKRFHVFRADVTNGKLENLVRLTGETKSDLPRYYYSPYDTEINPTWTRDGHQILFVSNKGHIHGTGGFWLQDAEPGASAREIHYEETSWKARPDFSPDGSRMVYSSYLGRQWHQMWVMPASGGDAFPISYGDWDNTNVRWSPDGKMLAYISNESGNTKIEIQSIPGSTGSELPLQTRLYKSERARIEIHVTDSEGHDIPARVSVTDSSGRFFPPDNARVFADDSFDRSQRPFEAHYFYLPGDRDSTLNPEEIAVAGRIAVPEGKIQIDVSRGLEYRPVSKTMDARRGPINNVEIRLEKLPAFSSSNWVSGDLHVHKNYGGTYLTHLADLCAQAEAEDVAIVNNLIVNKEQRFPDLEVPGEDCKFDGPVTVVMGQEFHTSYWGHRGLLQLRSTLFPGYAGYPNTAASSLYPTNARVFDMAHARGALVGAVHPFDEEPNPFANPPQRITDELPVDVALGKLDYMEIVGFSDHKATAAVWYRLLNLGFRIPAGAGTDATTNYAAPIRGNVGFDRVYATVPKGPLDPGAWLAALKAGKTFATNGPLIEFTLGGQIAGSELKFEKPQPAVPFAAALRSIVPLDHLEILCNGKVVQNLKLEGTRDSTDVKGTLSLSESGWCLLRAFSDNAAYPVLDKYSYATTSPIYVSIAGHPHKSPDDAKYFVAWIDRVLEITSHYPGWNSPAEKESVLKQLRDARAIYEKMQ